MYLSLKILTRLIPHIPKQYQNKKYQVKFYSNSAMSTEKENDKNWECIDGFLFKRINKKQKVKETNSRKSQVFEQIPLVLNKTANLTKKETKPIQSSIKGINKEKKRRYTVSWAPIKLLLIKPKLKVVAF